jgi:hypothetical protein
VELADSGSVLETFAFDQPYDRSQIAGFRLQSRPAVEGSSSGTPSVRDQIQAVAKGKPAVSRERPPGRYALAFDGKKDYLFIPDSPSLQANPPYFIEAWIKPDIEPSDDGSGQGLLAKGAIIEGGTKSLLQGLGMRLERRTREPTALFVDAMLSVGDKMVPASSGHYLNKPNGQWVHAGGAFQPGGISGMGDVSALGQPLVVGRFLTPTEKPFKGLIGEVRIWRYVGSMSGWGSGEEPLTGNEPGLIACWTFEEGRGQIAYDISPNHNHARLGNSLGVDGADPKWVDLSATPELAKAVDSSTAKPEKKESAGSALELRIAPQQDELAPGVVDECRKALAEGRAPADNHYIWLPVRPGMNLPRLAVIQAQESRTWLLVHNNDPFIMVPAQGWHLRQVARTTDDNGRSAVAVYFDDGGTERLRQLTKANGDHPLAEIVNGVVICAPMIVKSPSGLPSIVIVGNFTDQEIDSLIATLRQGEGEPAGKGAGGGALAEPAPSAAGRGCAAGAVLQRTRPPVVRGAQSKLGRN